MSKKTPEGKLKEQVKEFLDSFGKDVWYYMPVQTGYGKPVLDFVVCFFGLFMQIETKSLETPHGRAGYTALQQKTADEVCRAHGIVLLVTEENFGDTCVYLTELAEVRKGPYTTGGPYGRVYSKR